jgi:hypothetical protein
MASRDPLATPETRRNVDSATNSPGKDGLDQVELSDLDSSPPQIPVEQDLMQLARLGELRGIQKLFDSGRYNAKATDEQGITALHVCLGVSFGIDIMNGRLMLNAIVGSYKRSPRALSLSPSIRCRRQRQRW